MKKIYLLLIIGLLSAINYAHSQVNAYTFTSSQGTYTPITGGTAIRYGTPVTNASVTYPTLDDDLYYNRSIGFSFVYNGSTYTSFGFNSNGWLLLGNSTTFTSTSAPISTTTSSINNLIAAGSADLYGGIQVGGTVVSGNNFITANSSSPTSGINVGDSITGTGIPTPGAVVTAVSGTTVTIDKNTTSGSTSATWRIRNGEIRYETIGNSPNRTLVLQFSTFGRFSTSAPGDRMNFQIRLNETSNSVQVVYGTWSSTYTGTALTLQTGLKGASASDYNNRTSTTSWPASTAGTASTSAMTFTSTVTPTDGLTYTWAPPSCFTPSTVSVGSITTSTASVSFTTAGSNYIVEYGAAGFTPGTGTTAGSGGTIVTGTTSPVALSGLTPGTIYDVYVRQNCTASGNGFSTNSAKVTFTTTCSAVTSFSENFDGTAANALPTCFRKVGNAGSVYVQASSASSSPNALYIYSVSNTLSSQALVALPPVSNAGAGTNQLRFKLRANLTAGDTLQVGYITNIADSSSFVVLSQFRAASTTTYSEFVVTPGTAPGSSQYLAFRAKGTSGYSMLVDDVYWEAVPACTVPSGVSVGSITNNSASVSFTSTGNSFVVEYGATGFTPGTGATAGTGGIIITSTSSPVVISGLSGSTTYQVYVRQNCTAAGSGYSANSSVISFTTAAAPPVNDDATGAITLTVGAGCSGAPYTLAGATVSTGEPYPSCSGSAYGPVWFKFTAPASGAVRVSTDLGTGNTLTDSKLGLFSATNASNYSTFSIISCDEDGGSVGSLLSVLYATGLTPNATYYIAVDRYASSSTAGTFCVAVDDFATSMLSTTDSCGSSYQTPFGSNSSYTGWVPLLDGSSKLVALVQNPAGGSVSSYAIRQNVNTGSVRQSQGTYYLDRNFRITNSTATNVNVQFFLLQSELAALQAADPLITLSNLGITRQTETVAGCYPNFDTSKGPISFFPQTGNGSANGVNWISFVTPGFSNFYLHRNGTALPIQFEYLRGKNVGSGNALTWKVTCTSASITMVLERSADGRTFNQAVTSITATQARCGQPFDYTDAAPLNGTNYYRLKMIDVDGKVSYSPVVALLNGKAGAELVGIYPTIVKDQAYLSVTSSRNTQMQISISDMSGKVIRTTTQAVSSGSSLLNISTSNLASGVYNVTGVLDGVRTQTLRFVKQ